MLLEAQDDVVGESCPSQFGSESLPPMMAAMRAELPRMPVLDKNSRSVVDFRGSSASSNARSWLQQRAHIRRDEAEPTRCANGDWESRNLQRAKVRPSASAMVLARKRDEQRKLLSSKKQCTDSDGSDCNAGDSERDSLDMEEQLTAFVEYNATDMDGLDINPSQDFDGVWRRRGDEEQAAATQASQYMEACSWEDVTDVNQFQEEASEVFDNVIYAPRPASIPVGSSASTKCRPQGKHEFGIARPSFQPTDKNIPEKRAVVGPLSDDSEGSLSDGFDVAVNLASKATTTAEDTSCSDAATSKAPYKPKWRQRRSVKRDCSFIDNSRSHSVNGRFLLMASPHPVTTSEASQTLSDRVIELKDGYFDSSDDLQEDPNVMRDSDVPSSVPTSSVDTTAVVSSSLPSSATYSDALHPRLVRKRRKVGQLTLDGFLRSKMS
ncbi:Transcription initiation factor TFIID subunit 13 [Phytophthora pseudosyringae]|uniref:Transcription initiation factor TFIID subunit 13 n=1 Tax=Phytophthora pseudosyringae TaxID=221518 RepID=A0A8T1WMI1_9STRA|nr:Transcription initiation factor TFIID subunit 13 [Phytophthora pseudosyringae]